MMADTTTENSWMVCLREGIEYDPQLLGDLRSHRQTRVGESVVLVVTCSAERIQNLASHQDVDYVEPDLEASQEPYECEQAIRGMTIQERPDEWIVRVKAEHVTEFKEYIKTNLPSVKILSDTEVDGDSVFTLRASEADQKKMDNLSLVRCIERNSVGDFAANEKLPPRPTGSDIWALSRIAVRDNPLDYSGSEYRINANSTGRGVDVYVLDSGIDFNHSEFDDVSFERSSNVEARGDKVGHGTKVASLVAGKTVGVAPQANLIDVKVSDKPTESVIKESELIDALGCVIKHSREKKHCIANISIVFKAEKLQMQTLINQIRCCRKAGVTIVVAAGNDGSSACNYLPAGLPECITVASSTRVDHLAEHSNHGSCVDVVAPGEDVLVAIMSGNQDLALCSGTSCAAAIVSGAIARYLSEMENTKTPDEVDTWLKNHSTPDQLSKCDGTPNRLVHACFAMSM